MGVSATNSGKLDRSLIPWELQIISRAASAGSLVTGPEVPDGDDFTGCLQEAYCCVPGQHPLDFRNIVKDRFVTAAREVDRLYLYGRGKGAELQGELDLWNNAIFAGVFLLILALLGLGRIKWPDPRMGFWLGVAALSVGGAGIAGACVGRATAKGEVRSHEKRLADQIDRYAYQQLPRISQTCPEWGPPPFVPR